MNNALSTLKVRLVDLENRSTMNPCDATHDSAATLLVAAIEDGFATAVLASLLPALFTGAGRSRAVLLLVPSSIELGQGSRIYAGLHEITKAAGGIWDHNRVPRWTRAPQVPIYFTPSHRSMQRNVSQEHVFGVALSVLVDLRERAAEGIPVTGMLEVTEAAYARH